MSRIWAVSLSFHRRTWFLMPASPDRQAALIQSIYIGRAQIHSQLNKWPRRDSPLEQHRQAAASLSASRTSLMSDEEELRRSQREGWKREKEQSLRELKEARVDVTRSLINFRAGERAERVGDMPPPLRPNLGKQYAKDEMSKRVERRRSRATSEQRWPARPATAPAPPRIGPPEPEIIHPRGRIPPRKAPIWSDGEAFSVRGRVPAAMRRIEPSGWPSWHESPRMPPRTAGVWPHGEFDMQVNLRPRTAWA